MASHYASPEARERDRKRKIYKRQVASYLKKASKSMGMEKKRYETAARSALENVISTLGKKSKVRGDVAKWAEQLNVDMKPKDVSDYMRNRAFSRAESNLAKNRGANESARTLLQGVAGSRFWSATSDIWEASRYQDREEAVIDWFKQRFDGVENLMDVLEIIEQVAPGIYDEEKPQVEKYSEKSMYTDVTKTISAFVALG